VIYYFLGDIAERNGNREDAIKFFSASIQQKGGNVATSHYRRGKLLLENGQFERAVRDFSWTICSLEKPVHPYLERGISILMLGHDEIAQKDFDKFLELNPAGKDEMLGRIEGAKTLREKFAAPKPQ
jgi:tetratricopeptide (TPR) repeat protein